MSLWNTRSCTHVILSRSWSVRRVRPSYCPKWWSLEPSRCGFKIYLPHTDFYSDLQFCCEISQYYFIHLLYLFILQTLHSLITGKNKFKLEHYKQCPWPGLKKSTIILNILQYYDIICMPAMLSETDFFISLTVFWTFPNNSYLCHCL